MGKKEPEVAHRQLGSILAVVGLIILTVLVAVSAYLEESNIATFLLTDSLTVTHLASYIGGFWIAIFVPIYHVLKHRRPSHVKSMLKIHVFGNLTAFALITAHYVHREDVTIFLGTGTALYIAVLSLIVTGILLRLNITKGTKKQIQFVHVSMTTAFYLILIIHIIGTFFRL